MSNQTKSISEGQNNDIKSVATGAGTHLIGAMLGRVFIVVMLIFLSRVLTIEEFGLFSLGWSINRILIVISVGGIPNGLIRFGAPFYDNSDWQSLKNTFSQTMPLSFGFGLIVAIIITLTSDWIATEAFGEPDFGQILILFGWALPFESLMISIASATRLKKTTHYYVFLRDFGPSAIQLGLMIVFYLFGGGLTSILIAFLITRIIFVILGYLVLRQQFPDVLPVKRTASIINPALIAFSMSVMLLGALSIINLRLDRIMIGYFLDVEEVGIYQAIAQFVLIFTVIDMSFISILSPTFSSLIQSGAKERTEAIYNVGAKWATYLGLPVFVLVILFPEQLVTLFFGELFVRDISALRILAVSEMGAVMAGTVSTLLVMAGHERKWLFINIGIVFANILLNIALIPVLGLPGAALSTFLVTLLIYVLGLYFMQRELGIVGYRLKIRKGILSAMIAGFIAVGLDSIIDLPLLLHVILMTSTIGVTYITVLVLLQFDEEDNLFLMPVRQHLPWFASNQ